MSVTKVVYKMDKIYASITNLDQLSIAATYCYLMVDKLNLDCDGRNVLVAYKSQLYRDTILRLTK